MKIFNLQQILTKELVGKVLQSLEYENDSTTETKVYNKKIIKVCTTVDTSCEDPIIYMSLEDGTNTTAYCNENINISDEKV